MLENYRDIDIALYKKRLEEVGNTARAIGQLKTFQECVNAWHKVDNDERLLIAPWDNL